MASKIQNDIHELIKNPLTQVNEIERIEITGGNSLQVSIDFDYFENAALRDFQQDQMEALY